MSDYTQQLSDAVRLFWQTRKTQQGKQGASSGVKDYGSRGSVTGGKQLDGFADLLRVIVCDCGITESEVKGNRRASLPGYFRPTKDWDLVVVVQRKLVASIEFKSQIGSIGNNLNNRVEESLGNSTDLLKAYEHGAFRPSTKPWLGFLMVLEESEETMAPVRINSPNFPVLQEFINTTYAQRYEIFLQRLVRERFYDAACLLLTSRDGGPKGRWREVSEELSFSNFVTSLSGRAIAFARSRI